MRRQLRTIRHLPIPIAYHNSRITALEIIAENNMVIPKYAQPRRIDKKVPINRVPIPMPQRKLCPTIPDRIISYRQLRRLHRDQLILTRTLLEYIVLHDTAAVGKTEPAETELQRLRPIPLLRLLVKKIVMMNMQPLCDLPPLTANSNKTPHSILMLKTIVVYLMVIAIQQQILPIPRRLKQIMRPPAMTGTTSHDSPRRTVREFEPLNDNIRRRAENTEPSRTRDLRPTDSLGPDNNRPGSRPLTGNSYRPASRIHTISKNDNGTRRRLVDGGLETRKRRDRLSPQAQKPKK